MLPPLMAPPCMRVQPLLPIQALLPPRAHLVLPTVTVRMHADLPRAAWRQYPHLLHITKVLAHFFQSAVGVLPAMPSRQRHTAMWLLVAAQPLAPRLHSPLTFMPIVAAGRE